MEVHSMRIPSSAQPKDVTEEELLQATLHDHAQTVDSERGRAALAEGITSPEQITDLPQGNHSTLHHLNDHPGLWKIVTPVAAVALLTIFLTGTILTRQGFLWEHYTRGSISQKIHHQKMYTGTVPANNIFFWDHYTRGSTLQKIHDQKTYTGVGQIERVGQITITVNWAYVDLSNTLIAYDIQMPASLAKQYNNVTLTGYSLTAQQAPEPGGGAGIGCEGLPRDGSPEHCILDAQAFNPIPGVTQITLTLDIPGLYLIPPPPAGNIHILDTWRFQFTVRFNQTKIAPPPP